MGRLKRALGLRYAGSIGGERLGEHVFGAGRSSDLAGPVAVIAATIPSSVNAFYPGLVRELRSRGLDVHIVCSPGVGIEDVAKLADKTHPLPMVRGISPLRDLIALGRWVRLLRSLEPQLVVGGTPKAAMLAMISARLVGTPRRVYHLLGLRVESSSGLASIILSAAERLTARCSSIVVAVSPSLAREYAGRGLSAGTPVVVVGSGSTHGVDAERYRPGERDRTLARQIGVDLSSPTLVFIGRLTRDKGLTTLVELMRRIGQTRSGVQLLVVGPEDDPNSASLVEELASLPGTVLVGDQRDVRPYLALGDVLVLPTHREGMPNVVLEAGAMGIPSVTTTATGAVDSVVDGATGYAVPVEDVDTMTVAVERLLANPRLRSEMGVAARTRALNEFDPDEVHRRNADVMLGTAPQASS